RLLPRLAGAGASAPERSKSQTPQWGHQLPFSFSPELMNASPSLALAAPTTNEAFGLVGGLRRLCRWPLFERTNVVLSPKILAVRYTAFHGVIWSVTPATTYASALTRLISMAAPFSVSLFALTKGFVRYMST